MIEKSESKRTSQPPPATPEVSFRGHARLQKTVAKLEARRMVHLPRNTAEWAYLIR